MGLTGGLVRRVFSKSRSSTGVHDGNERNFGVEKSRWSSVRIYLCGDELNSFAEDDFASVRGCSEATVVQPVAEGSGDGESCPITKSEELDELIAKQEENENANSSTKSLGREDAAIYIQSAIRGFLARRRYEHIRQSAKGDHTGGLETPIGASEAMSTEVQIGDSESIVTVQHRVLHKARSQVYRLKEEWDDSTISSNISKLRIQNKLEASTRRERALAYAFSQQLRTCSKKNSTRSDSTEPNVGWSWLERWMAARLPESSSADDCLSKHVEPMIADRRPSVIMRRRFEVAMEEKESCGSNDVSIVGFDGFTTPCETPREGYGPVKNSLKDSRALSRRKTSPDYHHPPRSSKVSKRDSLREAAEKGKKLQRYTCQPPSDYY